MEIRYVKADPTGNITALVEAYPHNLSPSEVSERVFGDGADIEQLGFLSESTEADIALRMAGGEFCGNACLSAAAYHLRRRGSERGTVRVAMSGAEDPVTVELRRIGENEYAGSVDMPLPLAIERLDNPLCSAPIVRFPGISHVILPASTTRTAAEELIRPLCNQLKAEALGLMLFDEEKGTLSPLVCVPGAESLFWEHSCASGTSAVGAYMAAREGRDISLTLRQSGGSLGIEVCFSDGSPTRLRLSGKVRLFPPKRIEI